MKSFIAGMVVLVAGLGSLFAANPDFDKILAELDTLNRFTDVDFTSTMTMVSEDPAEGTEKMVVTQFRRDTEDKFLMLMLEPSTRKGQGYLRIDDNLWMYDPESRKFSHTSMKESFEGTAARNSDFNQSSLSEDYAVASSAEGRLGAYDVYVLDLAAKHNEVTYPFAKVWIRKDNHLLLKTEEYSLSRRLMRTSLFPKYAQVGERIVPTSMIFRDELTKGKQTTITVTNISTDRLPDKVFTKAYVEQVNR